MTPTPYAPDNARVHAMALGRAIKKANIRITSFEKARSWEWSSLVNVLMVQAESLRIRGIPFDEAQFSEQLQRAAIEDQQEAKRVHTVQPYYEPLRTDGIGGA